MKAMTRRSLLRSSALGLPASQLKAANPPAAGSTYKLVRTIPVEEGYDIVVAGGGPAGTAAAVCAARLGAKVLLLEATGCLGGMGTSGLVTSFNPMADGYRMIVGGFMREVVETMYRRGFLKPGIDPNTWRRDFHKWTPFQPEGLKLVLDEFATSAGVEVRFFTTVIDAEADRAAGRVAGVVLHNIEGYRFVRAQAFIDCTGDAVLAKLCGVVCREAGRDTPGIMPPTHTWLAAGIDFTRLGNQQAAVEKAIQEGFFTQPDRHLPGLQQIGRTIGFVNAGHLFRMDALRAKSLTEGMMRGRRLNQEYLAFYRKYVSGCENMEMVIAGHLMGVRESRRILGEYELTVADYLARRQFPDQIGVYNGSIDVHPYDATEEEYQRYYRDFTRTGRLKPGECVGIPYGVLVPKGWKNLWVAGRSVSTDVRTQGAIRVQPPAYMMGQAAGTAALQSIRTGRSAADINTAQLVAALREAGAYLPQTETSPRMTRSA